MQWCGAKNSSKITPVSSGIRARLRSRLRTEQGCSNDGISIGVTIDIKTTGCGGNECTKLRYGPGYVCETVADGSGAYSERKDGVTALEKLLRVAELALDVDCRTVVT